MGGILYFGVKFVAYALWCLFGLRLFQPPRASPVAMAIGLGALRSFMGLGFEIGIWLIGSLVYSALSQLPAPSFRTYMLVYVPVRWLEWSIMLVMLTMSVSSRILSRACEGRSTLESRRNCSFMPFRHTDDHLARRDSTCWEIHVLRRYRGASDRGCNNGIRQRDELPSRFRVGR
jgi:hypothetical protein